MNFQPPLVQTVSCKRTQRTASVIVPLAKVFSLSDCVHCSSLFLLLCLNTVFVTSWYITAWHHKWLFPNVILVHLKNIFLFDCFPNSCCLPLSAVAALSEPGSNQELSNSSERKTEASTHFHELHNSNPGEEKMDKQRTSVRRRVVFSIIKCFPSAPL